MWYICIMAYYSAIEKNEIIPSAATWMDPEIVLRSEVRQRQTNMLSQNLKKSYTNKLIYKTKTDSQT